MRLFFDSNILTYIAIFEGFLMCGTREELEMDLAVWNEVQGYSMDSRMLKEVKALRLLYLLDEQAHFDWLFSDVGLDEVLDIRDRTKLSQHYDLLDRIVEHRGDVYVMEHRNFSDLDRERLCLSLFPDIPDRMRRDALQFAESELLESDFFITNDHQFIKRAWAAKSNVLPYTPSQLPVLEEFLDKPISLFSGLEAR